ncbi:hypothetical protein RRG08_029776 [Elysia crispata]|uniref:Uncharacterized protein n=1 Tax=Elysia crispata TaxID=231223 RepID=A0AAE1EA53_9GAST|nr:hypothetical protein RRG08_029776 [Elysia crispata]
MLYFEENWNKLGYVSEYKIYSVSVRNGRAMASMVDRSGRGHAKGTSHPCKSPGELVADEASSQAPRPQTCTRSSR